MGTKGWVIPVAVLGAIVAVGLIFIWWWFPRAWKKGDRSDAAEVQAMSPEQRAIQRQANRDVIERYTRKLAIERGEVEANDADIELGVAPPPPVYESGPEAKVPTTEEHRIAHPT